MVHLLLVSLSEVVSRALVRCACRGAREKESIFLAGVSLLFSLVLEVREEEEEEEQQVVG